MSDEKQIHYYPCPGCEKEIPYSTENPWRPFCSASCQNKDFLAWTEESYQISRPDSSEEDE